jgi:chromosome segregation ATPase
MSIEEQIEFIKSSISKFEKSNLKLLNENANLEMEIQSINQKNRQIETNIAEIIKFNSFVEKQLQNFTSQITELLSSPCGCRN